MRHMMGLGATIEGRRGSRIDLEEEGRYLGIPQNGTFSRLTTVQGTGCGTYRPRGCGTWVDREAVAPGRYSLTFLGFRGNRPNLCYEKVTAAETAQDLPGSVAIVDRLA